MWKPEEKKKWTQYNAGIRAVEGDEGTGRPESTIEGTNA